MNISGIEANASINLLKQDSSKSGASKNIGLNEVEDSFSESGETLKFKEIVGKYEITNMSRNEANQMFKELMDNNLVSLKDISHAIFDPTHIPGWQDGVSSASGWKMSSNPDTKMNFLEGFKIQADWNKKYGNSEFQDNYDKMLELAEKIHYFQS